MVPAEHIRLELGAQNLRLEILDRTGLAIGAVLNSAESLPSVASSTCLAASSIESGSV
jgi:hypothetical protein